MCSSERGSREGDAVIFGRRLEVQAGRETLSNTLLILFKLNQHAANSKDENTLQR